MSATAPVTPAKLRLDDATRLIEKYGVDMADSIRNARKSPRPKCDDNYFLDQTEKWYQAARMAR